MTQGSSWRLVRRIKNIKMTLSVSGKRSSQRLMIIMRRRMRRLRKGALERPRGAYCGAVVLGEAAVHVALYDRRLPRARLADHQHFVKLLGVIASATTTSFGNCPVRVHLWLSLCTLALHLLVTRCSANRTLPMRADESHCASVLTNSKAEYNFIRIIQFAAK